MPIFRVNSVKIYTGQKNLHWRRQWRQWQLWGMLKSTSLMTLVVEMIGLVEILDFLLAPASETGFPSEIAWDPGWQLMHMVIWRNTMIRSPETRSSSVPFIPMKREQLAWVRHHWILKFFGSYLLPLSISNNLSQITLWIASLILDEVYIAPLSTAANPVPATLAARQPRADQCRH